MDERSLNKQEMAVLQALAENPAGLVEDDFREATKRRVSRHTVGEHLVVLLGAGMIVAKPEAPTDRRIKGTVDRFFLTEAGDALVKSEASQSAVVE